MPNPIISYFIGVDNRVRTAHIKVSNVKTYPKWRSVNVYQLSIIIIIIILPGVVNLQPGTTAPRYQSFNFDWLPSRYRFWCIHL